MCPLITFRTDPYEFLEPLWTHLDRADEDGQELSHREFWFSVAISDRRDPGLEIATDADHEYPEL